MISGESLLFWLIDVLSLAHFVTQGSFAQFTQCMTMKSGHRAENGYQKETAMIN